MKKAIIICGFPGVGKTSAANNRANILDAESSAFAWDWNPDDLEKGMTRNPAFPHNYIKFIMDNMDKYDVILVSSHQTVRDALMAEGIQYIIATPYSSLRNEYMIRYLQRGSDIDFIEQLYEHWEEFITSIVNDGAPIIWMDKGEYLTDILGVMAR